jgi:hypothetical protein
MMRVTFSRHGARQRNDKGIRTNGDEPGLIAQFDNRINLLLYFLHVDLDLSNPGVSILLEECLERFGEMFTTVAGVAHAQEEGGGGLLGPVAVYSDSSVLMANPTGTTSGGTILWKFKWSAASDNAGTATTDGVGLHFDCSSTTVNPNASFDYSWTIEYKNFGTSSGTTSWTQVLTASGSLEDQNASCGSEVFYLDLTARGVAPYPDSYNQSVSPGGTTPTLNPGDIVDYSGTADGSASPPSSHSGC